MIELNALFRTGSRETSDTGDYRTRIQIPGLPHISGHRAENLELWVMGDELVSDSFFANQNVSLVCNADLWNANALRQSLGLSSETTIAHLLAKLYEKNGENFVLDLEGAFALILYDRQERVLRAYSDPFGVRTLVHAEVSAGMAVSTDARRLLRGAGLDASIDPLAVLEYLQHSCIPAPRTIFRGVKRLEPGYQLTSEQGGRLRRYWDMRYPEKRNGRRNLEEWMRLTEAGIRESVKDCSQGAVEKTKLGCFLSGGTDSSSIAGLLGEYSGSAPRSFSIGFDDPRYNEIEYARIAARHFKADHSEYFVKPQDIVDLIPKACFAYDEPFGNSSVVPTFYCARLAKDKGITHLLAGDGGDELFGGNERYASDRVFQKYQCVPRWARTLMLEPAAGLSSQLFRGMNFFQKAASYVRRANIPFPDRIFSYTLLRSFPPEDFLSPGLIDHLRTHDPLEPARRHVSSASATSDLNRWLYMDMKMIISDNDLRKVTRMGDLAGVVVRYPFLNLRLAEFTGTIPSSLKVRGTQLRYLFKRAMSRVLPPEIIAKKKHGFGLPYCVWLGEYQPLKDFAFDVLGSQRARERGYFRKDLLEWLWDKYENDDRKYFGDNIWLFVMLELWHQQPMDFA